MSKQLSEKQLNNLEPLERYFGTAIRSGYCSYPGEANIELMRSTWAELTNQVYPFRAGCATCIFNLIRDLGTLYFAARPERNVAPEQTRVYNAQKPGKSASSSKTNKTTQPKGKPGKSAKQTGNTKK